MLAPNRQGAVTNAVRSSHGDDMDSDGTCVTGPQPCSEGKTRVSPVCRRFPLSAGWNRNVLLRQAGHPVAGCHGLQAVEEVTVGIAVAHAGLTQSFYRPAMFFSMGIQPQ